MQKVKNVFVPEKPQIEPDPYAYKYHKPGTPRNLPEDDEVQQEAFTGKDVEAAIGGSGRVMTPQQLTKVLTQILGTVGKSSSINPDSLQKVVKMALRSVPKTPAAQDPEAPVASKPSVAGTPNAGVGDYLKSVDTLGKTPPEKTTLPTIPNSVSSLTPEPNVDPLGSEFQNFNPFLPDENEFDPYQDLDFYQDLEPNQDFDPYQDFNPYQNLDPSQDFDPYQEPDPSQDFDIAPQAPEPPLGFVGPGGFQGTAGALSEPLESDLQKWRADKAAADAIKQKALEKDNERAMAAQMRDKIIQADPNTRAAAARTAAGMDPAQLAKAAADARAASAARAKQNYPNTEPSGVSDLYADRSEPGFDEPNDTLTPEVPPTNPLSTPQSQTGAQDYINGRSKPNAIAKSMNDYTKSQVPALNIMPKLRSLFGKK
jgi:hypothetical protein